MAMPFWLKCYPVSQTFEKFLLRFALTNGFQPSGE